MSHRAHANRHLGNPQQVVTPGSADVLVGIRPGGTGPGSADVPVGIRPLASKHPGVPGYAAIYTSPIIPAKAGIQPPTPDSHFRGNDGTKFRSSPPTRKPTPTHLRPPRRPPSTGATQP